MIQMHNQNTNFILYYRLYNSKHTKLKMLYFKFCNMNIEITQSRIEKKKYSGRYF